MGCIGAATTATSDIAMGAESLSEAATPEIGATPEATQATRATLEAAAPEGYLGSSPDPGCEFPASTSQKNTGESFKTMLFDEYEESEW